MFDIKANGRINSQASTDGTPDDHIEAIVGVLASTQESKLVKKIRTDMLTAPDCEIPRTIERNYNAVSSNL